MPTRKKKLLIVDDEPDIRKLLSESFKTEYSTLVAKDGEDAIKIIFEKTPDLVILDIKMPKMNGLDVLKKVKHFFPSMPVILYSAFSSYKTVYAASLADAFVVKSPNLEELFDTVSSLVQEIEKPS